MIYISDFFAKRVISNKTSFENVPAKLKDQVRDILIESGFQDLINKE